jgi:hypothetical protein
MYRGQYRCEVVTQCEQPEASHGFPRSPAPPGRCQSLTGMLAVKSLSPPRRALRPPAPACLANPPYPGRHGCTGAHPDYGGEVDHAALIAQLTAPGGAGLVHIRGGAPSRADVVPCRCPGRCPAPGGAADPQPVAAARLGACQLLLRAPARRRAAPGRLAGMRQAARHAAWPGDRRQARHGVPAELHPARRRAW